MAEKPAVVRGAEGLRGIREELEALSEQLGTPLGRLLRRLLEHL